MILIYYSALFIQIKIINLFNTKPLISFFTCNFSGGPTVSGLDIYDYPNINSATLINVNYMRIHSKVPLPSEVMEHFGRILLCIYNLMRFKFI